MKLFNPVFASALLIPCVASLLHAAPKVDAAKLADEAKRQCRSIHLGYQMKESTALYNEIVVANSAPGTYFCALGFNRGYFGMQELANGKKLIIFSVWDKSQTNDKHAVEESKRARVLETGEGVRTGRFGGEGTGAQSFYDYDWKNGETVRFLVQAKQSVVDGTTFTDFKGWFYDNQRKQWQHMTTLRTPTTGIKLRGGYSFVEDFRRNYKSAKIMRRARFQNTWAKMNDGTWTPLTTARFTGDRNPATNVDAGKEGDGFFLQTGGDTEMKTNKLWSTMQGDKRTGKMPEGVKDLLK
ncbi:hypothetical protein NT6N_07750 [Oceaniferula spumae]|uniref:DUF5077 domain-containing protein n=1 Tax=Oceaniferula spumae TaxID=2979115 RepID=A0AAT9FIB6_9BACT